MTYQKIDELRKQLEYHNYKYYVENTPLISDFDFDKMMRELQDLESQHPEYTDANSPSSRVGSDVSSLFETVAHQFPMLSLSNTYSMGELKEYIDRIEKEVGQTEYVCELKFDGTAISLTYQDGKLLRAVTRGDGSQGDDVTANVRTIRTIPLTLQGDDFPAYFEIRGEIFMPYASFDKINQERADNEEALFANTRNAAAGTLKQQASSVVAKRGLDCTLYQIVGRDLPYKSHSETLDMARKWGFKVSDTTRVCRSVEQIEEYINLWDVERKNLPFPTDGIVIKVDSFADRKVLGFTSKVPKWAVAYKFKADEALTMIESVEFQVGRTGAITPVANLQPVSLAGTTVKRASLHNAEQIAMLDIRLGDMVYVEKGGEIIPKVTRVELSARIKDSLPFEYVTLCPSCGTELVKLEGEAKHYCPNQSGCKDQILGRIVHFISRKAMNIDGLGGETIELLLSSGLLCDMSGLYKLEKGQLVGLPRLGEKSADNIIESVKESLKVPFRRVLFGLGIRFVGETTAKHLANHFGSLDAIKSASREELVEAEEVGEKIADSILDYFSDDRSLEIIHALESAGVQLVSEMRSLESESLVGKKIVISGKFTDHSRDELKELIELHGGKNIAAVSAKADLLVAGENMGPAKLSKATKLGVRIISEQDLVRIIEGGSLDTAGVAPTIFTEEPSRPIMEVAQGSLFENTAVAAPKEVKKEKKNIIIPTLFD